MGAQELAAMFIEKLNQVPRHQEDEENEEDDIQVDEEDKCGIARKIGGFTQFREADEREGQEHNGEGSRQNNRPFPVKAATVFLWLLLLLMLHAVPLFHYRRKSAITSESTKLKRRHVVSGK